VARVDSSLDSLIKSVSHSFSQKAGNFVTITFTNISLLQEMSNFYQKFYKRKISHGIGYIEPIGSHALHINFAEI
jgi:hypothetical protein